MGKKFTPFRVLALVSAATLVGAYVWTGGSLLDGLLPSSKSDRALRPDSDPLLPGSKSNSHDGEEVLFGDGKVHGATSQSRPFDGAVMPGSKTMRVAEPEGALMSSSKSRAVVTPPEAHPTTTATSQPK